MKRERLIDAALLAIPLAVAVIAAAQSWHGWLDPIVDTGRDLYIPEQMRHGAKLYRDIVYYYPPLTPYLLAMVTAITGSSLAGYTAIGGAIAAATTAAIYILGRIAGGRWAGVGAGVLFAACSIAGRSTWGTNYFFPYAHAATLGMLFFIACVASLAAYLYAGRGQVWMAVALAFAFAASWTKIEYAAFTAVVLAFAFLIHTIEWRWFAIYVSALIASIVIASMYFSDSPAGRHWLFDNVAPRSMLGSPYLRAFYRAVAGVDAWPSLLWQSVVAALLLFAFVALARMARGSNEAAMKMLFAAGAVIAAAALLLREDGFFRAWTVLQLALVPFALRRRRDPLALLLLASLLTTSRVFFNVVPVWYGFVFLVPLYALCACALVRFAPRRFAMTLIAVVALVSLVQAHRAYARKIYSIETARGVLTDALPDRARAITDLQRFATASQMRSLVVMPEGLALNYLLKLPTTLAYYTFTPPESADPAVESRILSELEQKRPEWILIVPRALEEFGVRQFGVDYNRRIGTYLREKYAVAKVLGGPRYRMVLLRARPRS